MGRFSLSSAGVGGLLLLLFFGSSANAEIMCGAIITEEVTLKRDLTCETPIALRVVGPGGQLDLGGHTVRCGGIPETIGVLLVGERARLTHGTVTSCQSGVVAADQGRHRVIKITSRMHSSSAFATTVFGSFVDSDGNAFIGNYAEKTDVGFVISGNENQVFRNISTDTNTGFIVTQKHNKLMLNSAYKNRLDGFSIQGQAEDNHFIKNRAYRNGQVGFLIEGHRNKFVANYAWGNGLELVGAGFRLFDANNNFLAYNKAKKNTVNGFEIAGALELAEQNLLVGNTARENGKRGIALPFFAENNTITKNTAMDNGLVDLEDGNGNCDHNMWLKNTFSRPDPPCIQ